LVLMAMQISSRTGEICSFSARLNATGATSNTTATFSTNMDRNPASTQTASNAPRTVFVRSTNISASTAGIRECMNNSASTSVPANRAITFQ